MSKLKEENEALKAVPATETVKFKKIDPTKVENREVVSKGKFAEFIASMRK